MIKPLKFNFLPPSIVLAICFAITHQTRGADDSPSKLPSDCQVHVIGIYSPENSAKDDRVYVRVENTGKPMVLVLCGYFGAQWHLDLADKAQVKEIIVSGWFGHSIANVSEGIPVRKIIGSPRDASKPEKDYFWAYAWHTEQGRAMVEHVKALTGLGITTFQGTYAGKRFTIDGKLGLNPDQVDNPEEAGNEPSDAPALRLQGSERSADAESIEKFVRDSFLLDMAEKRKRIVQAEEDLARIKAKFAKREAEAEKLIQERIAAHLSLKSPSVVREQSELPTDAEVVDPAGKGWRLWQTQDWDEALRMFKIAVKRDPDSDAAWNGLGWTHLHLQELEPAKTAFEKALAIEPKNGGARNGLGRILMALGKFDDAEKELLRATEETIDEYGEKKAISLGVTASWFGLVEVLLAKEDLAAAESWAQRYLKHDPDQEQMLDLLSRTQGTKSQK